MTDDLKIMCPIAEQKVMLPKTVLDKKCYS